MMKKLITFVLLLTSLAACASGPATKDQGFVLRRTGLEAGTEFWGKYFLNVDNNNPYATIGDFSPMSSPNGICSEDSFHDLTYSHREATAPLYDKKSSSELFKSWVLNYPDTPYGE